jgi:ectoine hydroxylase-related dioxygenase (phytanoyl-CoA dioxygenase family)
MRLSSEQKQSFITNGYLKLPQAISPNLLEELRVAVDNLVAMGDQLSDSTVLESTNKQKFVVAIDKIAAKNEAVFRQLLGSPLLLSIAESICGADFFPVQDFVVIKTLGDQNEVKWHQDVITHCHEKTFMIGFYLDPTNDENGALRIIPGSHKSDLPICELEKMEYQSLDMQAGDILIHNLKIAHSSGELSTFLQRRVVYFEFMAANDIVKEEVYPESFVQLRTSLIPNAISCFEKAHPNEAPFIWNHPEKEKYLVAKDPILAIQEVYQVKKNVKAANYCFDFINSYST